MAGKSGSAAWAWSKSRLLGMDQHLRLPKSLGEMVIADAVKQGLNACIVRPSIVESAIEFPFPGWNEGMTTTAPIVLLTRQGLTHFPYDEDILLDLIPVDAVAGVIIAAAADLFSGAHKLVYHASSGDVNPLTVKKSIEFTGWTARKYAQRQNRASKMGWLMRNHELQPMREKTFQKCSVPLYKKSASKVIQTIDKLGPDRFAWMRQPAAVIRDFAEEIEKSSETAEMVSNMFMPFVARHKPVFRADNTRHVMQRIPEEERLGLHYAPEKIIWRDYWCHIHVPGLERWVLPKLEEEMAEHPEHAYIHRHLNELFETTTHNHRHRVALRYICQDHEEHLTYGELRALAFRVASFLVTHQVERDDKVLLVCENRPEWVAAYFGILLAGATAVPVDAAAKGYEIANIAKAAQAKGILLSPKQESRLTQQGAATQEWSPQGTAIWRLPRAINHSEELVRSEQPARLASIIFT
ncbi:MAG: AMP-binding protein, partial [Myxococcota bacterium]